MGRLRAWWASATPRVVRRTWTLRSGRVLRVNLAIGPHADRVDFRE